MREEFSSEARIICMNDSNSYCIFQAASKAVIGKKKKKNTIKIGSKAGCCMVVFHGVVLLIILIC